MKFYSRMAMVALAATIIATGVSRGAENAGKGHELSLFNIFSVRGVPREGASYDLALEYRYYFSDSESFLFENNHVGVGISDSVSPATNAVGAYLKFEPIAAFNLKVQYEYLQFFGEFTAMLLFDSPDADISDSVLDDLDEDNEAIWATGHKLSIQPTIQIMYKRFLALNMVVCDWYDMNGKQGYFYHPTDDILVKTEDFVFSDNVIAGVILWQKSMKQFFATGAYYNYLRVDSTDTERQALNGALLWAIGDKVWFMEEPMLVVAAGGYLQDEYREGDVFAGGFLSFKYTLIER